MTKKNREQLFFGIFAFLIATFLFVAPYFLIPQINSTRNNWLESAPSSAKFLELWEIDTFEGGSASRARFLEKIAFAYQEKTASVYVIVRSLKLEQAYEMIQNGARPDLISFGIGAGDMVSGLSRNIERTGDVRADLLVGGRLDGENRAIPWCMGGYVLCSTTDMGEFDDAILKAEAEKTELDILGTGYAFNLPARALDTAQREYLSDNRDYSQYQAYEAFLRGNEFTVLLGTQRDFFRLNNKVSAGAIPQMYYHYLNTYTDLIQYLSITTKDDSLVSVANDFIEFITSTPVQKKLTSIGMFGVTKDIIYQDEYSDFENALHSKLQVMNVFVSNVWLREEQKK